MADIDTRPRASSEVCGAVTANGGRCSRRGACPVHTGSSRRSPRPPAVVAGAVVAAESPLAAAGPPGPVPPPTVRRVSLRERAGRFMCKAGFHALRSEPGVMVDVHLEHEETCKRCGHRTRVPYPGI